ncbi:MAG: 2Fe-2S iron-sulfur cluster-binding protein [Gammaproteobacteria bacterium]
MPKVTFVKHDGATQQTVDIPVGTSVMQGAFNNTIQGIVGECGGGCACATCHVFVAPEWVGKIPPAQGTEVEMLQCTAVESTPNSRLCCQITVTETMDGLVVHLPERQY